MTFAPGYTTYDSRVDALALAMVGSLPLDEDSAYLAGHLLHFCPRCLQPLLERIVVQSGCQIAVVVACVVSTEQHPVRRRPTWKSTFWLSVLRIQVATGTYRVATTQPSLSSAPYACG